LSRSLPEVSNVFENNPFVARNADELDTITDFKLLLQVRQPYPVVEPADKRVTAIDRNRSERVIGLDGDEVWWKCDLHAISAA
jgi:hypothetical protein